MGILSSILSKLMTEHGIKSAELARKTHIGQPVIYRLMTGATDNPQVHTLIPIANYFDISLDQLLGLSPLNKRKDLDHATIHTLNNKLITIKTVATVISDLLPTLINGYKNALDNELVDNEIPTEIIPLLSINCLNLINSVNLIQEILATNHPRQEQSC